ncbi:hypothetical protein B5M09_005808 [Aphanomyces astaci]|uniref:TRAF-type domain-containing protein n=1 Tax=Aphanomyces astaci TaxID=112090 RepID=A0A425CT11_APHAT|nr:hypothetical protein B5M09_005808 [Aphanomyces astaci]
MMEQIRFSIKLEVDARAAIAERQLSAIMALTKSNSDELDRLRLEANTTDREVRGLDQAHQKLRQDMTTQKDIMYHVQSMAGKDESWRMQADNQLLELRQVIAAMREQLNSLQVSMQEKLSRPELLVHFNACVEPLKAQLNAGIQHQGTRTIYIADKCKLLWTSRILVTEGQSTLKALIAQSAAATTQIIRDEVERERSERKRQLDGLTDQLMQVKYSTHDSVHKGLHDIRIELKADLTAHDKELQAFCMSVVAKDVPPMLRKDVSEWQEVVQRVQADVAQIRQETIHCTNVMTVLQNDMQAQRKDVADHKTSLGTMGTDLSALKKEVESTTKIIQGQIDTILKDRVEGERSLQRRMEVEVTTLVQKGVVPFEQELRRINTRLDDLKKQEPISTPATASMMGPPPSPGYGYWPPHMYAMASPPNHSMDAHYLSTLLDDPSMKGALAEAELAKARVENRLKIEFPKGSKSDHDQLHCSMRMQTCPTCQSSMRAKDVASHLCDKPVAKCKHCLADVVDVLDHESKCEHALKQCPHCLRRQKVKCTISQHIKQW